jgi:hypothetical protein
MLKQLRLLTAVVCTAAVFCLPSHGQQAQDEKRTSYTVSLNQDTFFGFYPSATGSYKLNDRLDATVYGIFWTTPSFGTGGGGGLWTEFGGGVNVKTFDGKLQFNPQLGILNGKLLSNGQSPMALEGYVPNITVNLKTDKTEGQFYMGGYMAARTGERLNPTTNRLEKVPVQNNFLHWWVNGGYRISKVVSAGLHYEALGSYPDGVGNPPSADVYRWLGPYFQANLSDSFSLRFTAGGNVLDRPATDGNGSFYKMTASYTF